MGRPNVVSCCEFMRSLTGPFYRNVRVLPVIFGIGSHCLAASPGDDFNANTTTAITTLQQWYNGSGLWTTTGWWNAANCVDAVESASAAVNGQAYLGVLTNTFNLNS